MHDFFFFKFCIFMIINKFPLYYKCAIYFELCLFFFLPNRQDKKTNKNTQTETNTNV
jgi:hypothetical protein